MCGLAGIFSAAAISPDFDVAPMLKSIRHRGPDGEGRYRSPDGRFACGFARLAIIDLKTGDQPLIGRGETSVLVGNGEIYNYRELRSECGDYPFRSSGDMETVLALYERDGLDFIHRLNGMFGLALYDLVRRRLILVRDRLGIKPVYYARLRDGRLIFASEPKAIFASGLIAPEVDEAAVTEYLCHGYVPAPRTLFKGIVKLPPGHMLIASADGSMETRRYWRAEPARGLPSDREEIERHLLSLLEDSVRLQLRSDVPIGILLSGGIDSGLLAALAARVSDRPLNSFTVRFEGGAVDESPLARSVARRYGTLHREIDVSSASAAQMLPRLAWYCDEPLFDASLLPNYLIERELRHHVTVALNGTGGDELFAGYGRYFQLPVERRYLEIPRALRRCLIEPALGAVAPMTAWRLERAEKWTADRGAYLHDHGTLFPRPVLQTIGHRGLPGEPAQSRAFREFQGPPDTAALYADIATYLPEDLLLLLDRTSMAVGVEGRVPFLDHRLVEAALAVPPEIRAPGGRQKYLERSIARQLLPEEVLAAPKQGFASPVPAWMVSGLAAQAGRLLTRPRSLERNWWTKEGILRLIADPRANAFRIYSLIMLELCVRLHVESNAASPPGDGMEAFADAA